MMLIPLKCWLFYALELRVVPPFVNSWQVYAHTLAQQGREEEAKNVLANSFGFRSADAEFISDQFVSWVAKNPSQMEN